MNIITIGATVVLDFVMALLSISVSFKVKKRCTVICNFVSVSTHIFSRDLETGCDQKERCTVQCSMEQLSAVQCSAMQYGAVQYAVQCSTVV